MGQILRLRKWLFILFMITTCLVLKGYALEVVKRIVPYNPLKFQAPSKPGHLRLVSPGLWATEDEVLWGGSVNTAGFLLQRSKGNVFIYSSADISRYFKHISELGGVKDIFLNHRDEASPFVTKLATHFSANIWVHKNEKEACEAKGVVPNKLFTEACNHFDDDLDAYHTPGHTEGVMSYLWRNPEENGRAYLFPGDTLISTTQESIDFILSFHPYKDNKAHLRNSLTLLRDLESDVLVPGLATGKALEAMQWTPEDRQYVLNQLILSLSEK